MRAGSSRISFSSRIEPVLPVTAIGRALAALVVADARQQELIGIELVVGFHNALALLLQKLGQRFRFLLAAFGKIDLDLRQPLAGDLLQRRDEVGDIALDQKPGCAQQPWQAQREPRVMPPRAD